MSYTTEIELRREFFPVTKQDIEETEKYVHFFDVEDDDRPAKEYTLSDDWEYFHANWLYSVNAVEVVNFDELPEVIKKIFYLDGIKRNGRYIYDNKTTKFYDIDMKIKYFQELAETFDCRKEK